MLPYTEEKLTDFVLSLSLERAREIFTELTTKKSYANRTDAEQALWSLLSDHIHDLTLHDDMEDLLKKYESKEKA